MTCTESGLTVFARTNIVEICNSAKPKEITDVRLAPPECPPSPSGSPAAAPVFSSAIAGAANAEEPTLKSAVFVPLVDHLRHSVQALRRSRQRRPGKKKGRAADPHRRRDPRRSRPTAVRRRSRTACSIIAAIPPAYYKSQMVEGDAQILSDMTVAEQRKSGAYAALNAIAGERMNALYLTTYGIGVPFHFYVTQGDGDRQARGPERAALSRPAELQRAVQALRHRRREHRGAGGLHRAGARHRAGLGWPLWGINDFGWEKLTKVRIDLGFYNVVNTVLMNKSKYAALSPEQKKMLDDAVVWFEQDSVRYDADKTKETLEMQAKAGIKTVDFGRSSRSWRSSLCWDDLEEAQPRCDGESFSRS